MHVPASMLELCLHSSQCMSIHALHEHDVVCVTLARAARAAQSVPASLARRLARPDPACARAHAAEGRTSMQCALLSSVHDQHASCHCTCSGRPVAAHTCVRPSHRNPMLQCTLPVYTTTQHGTSDRAVETRSVMSVEHRETAISERVVRSRQERAAQRRRPWRACRSCKRGGSGPLHYLRRLWAPALERSGGLARPIGAAVGARGCSPRARGG